MPVCALWELSGCGSLTFAHSLLLSLLAYVLQVKVEMELEIQHCEKTKAIREEQLERLTQICQEQAVSSLHTDMLTVSLR